MREVMRGPRRLAVLATAVGGLLVVLAGAAWACTLQAPVIGVSPASGQPATTVTVRGQGMPRSMAGAGVPIQVHWNGIEGPKLAEVMSDANGTFAATVDIPAAAPDIYSVVAVADGVQLGRTAFEVGSPPTEALPATGIAPGTAWASPATVAPQGSAPSSPGLAAGAGVLAFGLVALSVGFTATSMRKGRRRAESPGSPSLLG